MQEVSAQQDESSVGQFRDASCVSSPSPSFCLSPLPFFLHLLYPLSVFPLSHPLFPSPSILATPSYIIYPRAFIIQQRPQQTNIFVRMIRDTMPDGGHQHHQRSSNSADTCCACSWCSYFPFGFEGRIWDVIVSVPDHCLFFYTVKVRTNNNISTQTAQNYQAPFCYKN